jgi:hypothetical protein
MRVRNNIVLIETSGERMHSRGKLYSSGVNAVIGIIAIEMRAEDAMKN